MWQDKTAEQMSALRWLSCLLIVGAAGALVTITASPLWPQVVMASGAVLIAALATWAPNAQRAMGAAVIITLAPVVWQVWALWQGWWSVSFWLLLAAVAAVTILLVSWMPRPRIDRSPTVIAVAAVLAGALVGTFAGGAVAGATAQVSEVAAATPAYRDGRSVPGSFEYGWQIRRNVWPVDTAYGTVQLHGDSDSVIAGMVGPEHNPAWTFELRPYDIVDFGVSSSGEVVVVQFGFPDVPVHREETSRVTRAWLDAGTGEVLHTIRWASGDHLEDEGDDQAIAATGLDWVMARPNTGDTVTYQDVLVGRYRIDTRAQVGLAFVPGGGQQVAWTREIPDRCGEYVIWASQERVWTLAATADIVAVARACVVEPAADGTPQVAITVHGVDADTGRDVWRLDGPEQWSSARWEPDLPGTDERILEDAVYSWPQSGVVVSHAVLEYGPDRTDPVILTLYWGGQGDEPSPAIDLATGERIAEDQP